MGLSHPAARAGSIWQAQGSISDDHTASQGSAAHSATALATFARLLRAHSSRGLHTWLLARCGHHTDMRRLGAQVRWLKSALTSGNCSIWLHAIRMAQLHLLFSSDYSTSRIAGAVPAEDQLVSPLSWAGASSL